MSLKPIPIKALEGFRQTRKESTIAAQGLNALAWLLRFGHATCTFGALLGKL